jgi:uncharacterized Tic20 family protein
MPRRNDDDDDDRDEDAEDDDDGKSSKKRNRGEPTNEDKQMAMFCHLGALVGGFLLPLILWITQKDKSRFIDTHGKEAVNFELTMLIGHIVGIFCTCGLLTFIILPLSITFHIMGGLAANRGEDYQYPICIRFIK